MRRDFQRLSRDFFQEISEISERFRGISRQVYEIFVSDGLLDWITRQTSLSSEIATHTGIHRTVGSVWDLSGIPGLWDGKDSGIECGMGVLSDTPDSGICLVGIPGLWGLEGK